MFNEVAFVEAAPAFGETTGPPAVSPVDASGGFTFDARADLAAAGFSAGGFWPAPSGVPASAGFVGAVDLEASPRGRLGGFGVVATRVPPPDY